jgi:hypothetical protein
MERHYYQIKKEITAILKENELFIQIFNGKMNEVKKVNDINKAIGYLMDNKKGSLEIEEIDFRYYAEVGPIDFTTNLLKLLKEKGYSSLYSD